MRKILQYVIASVMAAAVVLVVLGIKNTFVQTNTLRIYGDLSDAFFVPGVMFAGFGLLVFASNGGAFDMLKFGFIKLFDLFKRDLTKVKYRTFYDYSQAQKDKSKGSTLYLLVVGVVCLVVAAVFLVLYKSL